MGNPKYSLIDMTDKPKLLESGDVIYLKKGMKVYADIPEMFVIGNRKASKKLTHTDLVIGKKYKNPTDISDAINKVIDGIIEQFSWQGFELSKMDAKVFVRSRIEIPEEQEYALEEGEYLVLKTTEEGGGTAMFNDKYPDGHRVFCVKLVDGEYLNNDMLVDFYQTGCFTAMIEDIKPVRKFTLKFV